MPGAHARQYPPDVAAILVEYLPATQFKHVLESDAPMLVENVPAMHVTQLCDCVDPTVGEYVPRGQGRHDAALVADVVVE